jgi:hypothetical protein
MCFSPYDLFIVAGAAMMIEGSIDTILKGDTLKMFHLNFG